MIDTMFWSCTCIIQKKKSKSCGQFARRLLRRSLSSALPAPNEDKIVAALAAGANDYLLRPVRRGERATSVSVLLRQAYPAQIAGERFTFGPYLFESGRDRVASAGKPVDMTKKELGLALLFFCNLGQPIFGSTIIDSVWHGVAPELTRTIDTHLSRVRAKLKLTLEHGYHLSAVYGFGYRLDELKAHDTH